MAELRCENEVLACTGRDFEGFLTKCKLQKVERYSKQRHFTEIWDYRKGISSLSDNYRAELEILENLDITILDRRAPYALYEDIRLFGARTRGILEFDPTLSFKKEKYSDGRLPENWGFWEYDDIEHHPHTWIQRQKQYITGYNVELPLELKSGEYAIFDFGKIEAGFLAFQAIAMCESDVVIAFTEYYEGENFELPNMNAHNVLEYFLPQGFSDEVLSFEPYTCRFAIVAVKEGHIRLNSFGIKTFMFDTGNIELPDYKDETLNTIYRAAVRTFAHNAVDLYTDCPSRERAGWLCDSYFTAKTEYTLTGKTLVEDAFLENYRLYKDTGELLPGTLPMCYPADMFIHPADKEIFRFIPQWTMWYIIEVAEYVLKRGHKDIVLEFKESIYNLLDFYRQYENEDGLLECLPSWNFVEWSKANDWTKDVNYPTNFLYAQVLACIADLYGDENCRMRSEEVRKAAVEQSFNGTYFVDHAVRDENGKLVLQNHSSEACQYYAILFGGIDMADLKFQPLYHLIKNVFAPDRNGAMPEIMEVNAFIGAYLRLEALLKLEEYELLLKDVVGFFGNMGEYTETLWEYRQYKGSCDHGFASYALVAIEEAVKGLKSRKK
jgi:alpha-L-rhamnosidase